MKIIMLIIYIISVNLLSGYLAVLLKFPSLWGNSQIFTDYAMPLGLTWALSHWPSIIIFTIPLLLLSNWNTKLIQRFRIFCLAVFLLLIYGVIEKIPFALFSFVDSFAAFIFSIIIKPPRYKETPKLFIGLSVFGFILLICSTYYITYKWQHRVPTIKETQLMKGFYTLENIEVNAYKKELNFRVALNRKIPEEEICESSILMSEELFDSYQFDKDYLKIVSITFNPDRTNHSLEYTLGQIEQYREDEKLNVACYLKYK